MIPDPIHNQNPHVYFDINIKHLSQMCVTTVTCHDTSSKEKHFVLYKAFYLILIIITIESKDTNVLF